MLVEPPALRPPLRLIKSNNRIKLRARPARRQPEILRRNAEHQDRAPPLLIRHRLPTVLDLAQILLRHAEQPRRLNRLWPADARQARSTTPVSSTGAPVGRRSHSPATGMASSAWLQLAHTGFGLYRLSGLDLEDIATAFGGPDRLRAPQRPHLPRMVRFCRGKASIGCRRHRLLAAPAPVWKNTVSSISWPCQPSRS